MEHRNARACLVRTGPIAFIGDSVTRYQFITLSHYLAAGKYQFPYEGNKSLSNAHSFDPAFPIPGQVTNSYDKLWQHARKQVTRHAPNGDLYVNHNRAAAREHAHLQLKDIYSGGMMDMYYHYTDFGSVSQVRHALDWVLEKEPKVRYVILNVCAHYPPGKEYKMSRDVLPALSYAVRRLGSPDRLVWRSCTTPAPEQRRALDKAEAAIQGRCREKGVPVYDTRGVALAGTHQGLVTTWTPDTVHFMQFMYEQFNDLLLNILCE